MGLGRLRAQDRVLSVSAVANIVTVEEAGTQKEPLEIDEKGTCRKKALTRAPARDFGGSVEAMESGDI